MAEIKIGDSVKISGKVTEIVINEKGTLYRVKIYEEEIPNSWCNDVLVREKDIV